MAVTSDTTPLGTPLPDATLTDADGQARAVAELAGDGPVLVMFLADHCPDVQHREAGLGAVTGDDLRAAVIPGDGCDQRLTGTRSARRT